jgi:hypothetical protein
MFARDTFRTTYSGPIKASGETLSQAKSQAGAGRSFAGNQRAFRAQPQMQGVRAGSRGADYRAGIMADQQAAQAGDHFQAQIARMAQDGQARDQYLTNRTEEQDGLRRLLFDLDQTDNIADNALRKDLAFANVAGRQRQADQVMGRRSRKNAWLNVLGGLFS